MRLYHLYIILALILIINERVEGVVRTNENQCPVDSVGVVLVVDEIAKYRNGEYDILNFINSLTLDPDTSDMNFIPEVKMVLKLVISEEGDPFVIYVNGLGRNSKLLSNLESQLFDRFDNMGKWLPAKCNGQFVKSYVEVPFRIRFSNH